MRRHMQNLLPFFAILQFYVLHLWFGHKPGVLAFLCLPLFINISRISFPQGTFHLSRRMLRLPSCLATVLFGQLQWKKHKGLNQFLFIFSFEFREFFILDTTKPHLAVFQTNGFKFQLLAILQRELRYGSLMGMTQENIHTSTLVLLNLQLLLNAKAFSNLY